MARIVIPGLPHHVTQRGNRRARIFDDDRFRSHYLALLRQFASKEGVGVWAYCLMDNHVHLVVVPQEEGSLAHCFRRAHTHFALWANRQRR
jgi:putative transposase